MKLLRLAAAVALLVNPAAAQWQTPTHSIPTGQGGGVTGFGSVSGSGGQVLFGVTGADPVFRAPSFSDLVNNIAISQMGGGVGATGSTFFAGDNTWKALPVTNVPTIAALQALDTTTTTSAYLTDANRAGNFQWRLGNFTTAIATDTNNGVYVKATAISAGTGAWVRQFNFIDFWSKWFGTVADFATDNTAIINTMIATSNAQNALVGVGQQTSVYLNIEGGVKFASRNLQWLPGANWVYVYLRYFAPSDTTVGVSTGGLGTNEQQLLSVNSAAPGSGTGALVGEFILNAPVDPASMVNIQKNVDNSIVSHSFLGQSPQPTSQSPAIAHVATVRDENLNRFYAVYNHYGSADPLSGVYLAIETRTTDLTCAGCNTSTAWGANIPGVGAVVHGLTSLSRYVVTGSTTSILHTDWLSGTAVPGEFLLNERAIFQASISGNILTVTNVFQGVGNIAVGQTVAGMFSGNAITAGTTITGLGTGAGGVGTYSVNNSQTIPATQMTAGNVAANGIQGGGVTNFDALYTPLKLGFKGNVSTPVGTFATLVPCNAGVEGSFQAINDSTTATWGATITGAGANHVMAYCDGTNWTVMGK